MRYFKKRKETQKKQIDGVENILSGAFAPVAPSQDFITYLGDRLSSYPQSNLEGKSSTFKWYQYTLLAVISILGGGVLLALTIRLVITLLAWLSLMRQFSKESQSRFSDA